MNHKQAFKTVLPSAAWGAFLALVLLALGARTTVQAQGETPPVAATPLTATLTHTVQAGETLTRIGRRYGVGVSDLVAWNDIPDPDLIFVDQVLIVRVPEGTAPPATPPPLAADPAAGEPLAFAWSMVDWRPADPDYVATIQIRPQGGTPPYTFYHDGLVQEGATFEVAWRRCQPKPGSVGVADATGASVHEDYWLDAPYCPVGVQILEPEEGADLKHNPRHFNLTWMHTVDPPPALYGIEIEVWERGEWRAWKTYTHRRGEQELFFVPDAFPGDLGGRVRMWGIYGDREADAKTPWRTFHFRVTD